MNQDPDKEQQLRVEALALALSKELIEKGQLIEAGWQSLRMMSMPKEAPAVQLDEMKMAFFAGAHHVYSTIMTVMDDENDEPTEEDMDRMHKIHLELEKWLDDFKRKHNLPL